MDRKRGKAWDAVGHGRNITCFLRTFGHSSRQRSRRRRG
jgi:hypothetical protein